MTSSARVIAGCVALGICSVAVAAGAQPLRGATVEVTVLDPSGARVPHATVTLQRFEPEGKSSPEHRISVSTEGVAVASGLEAGRYAIHVQAEGFDPVRVPDVDLRPGRDARRVVRLSIARLTAAVDVDRDRQSQALDPRGFSTFLSAEQILALPDDPEAFARALRDMAPPGAVLRIDGF